MYIVQDDYGNIYYVPTETELFAQQFQTMAFTAMSLGIASSALGIILGATTIAKTTPLAKVKPSDAAIQELRKAYGDKIVDKALGDFEDPSKAYASEVAASVEKYVYEDLRARYGDWAANIAIDAAPPGDMGTAIAIAKTLSERRVTSGSTAAEKVAAVSKGKMVGRSAAEPVKDTKTGITYKSKYAAGKAIAGEYGLDPTNTHVYFDIVRRDPERFVRV
jgi:hypothetical protein